MTPRLGYRPELDGVRAVAIGLVVGLHAVDWPRGGYLGVDLFFVLSGFLITTLLCEEWQANGRVDVLAFYARRALRLMPALVVFLAVVVIVSALRGSLHGRFLWGAVYGLTYTTDITSALGFRSPYGHLWSLGVEEQFYLVWPLVLLVLLRRRLSARAIAFGLVATAIGVGLVRYGLAPAHLRVRNDPAQVTRFDSVMIGCAVALLLRKPEPWQRLFRSPAFVLPAVTVAATLAFLAGSRYSVYRGATLGFSLLAGGMMMSTLTVPWLRWSLSRRPLVFLGRISYPLYLWHLQVIRWGSELGLPIRADIVIAIAIATTSYLTVERYFLALKRRRVPRATDTRPSLMAV